MVHVDFVFGDYIDHVVVVCDDVRVSGRAPL